MADTTIFSELTKKNLVFSDINIIFGYAKSGKTSQLELLNSIFSAKEKGYLVDGSHPMPGDFDVIYVSSNESITNHLKLSSKSLLRNALENAKYSDSFKENCTLLSSTLNNLLEELSAEVSKTVGDSRVNIPMMDDPIDFLLGSVQITLDEDCSSYNRESLLSVIEAISKSSPRKTIVLMDDFASNFDEEATLDFFHKIKDSKATFILTSNKPLPQSIIDDELGIFAIREHHLYPLPPISRLLLDSLEGQASYTSFEQYMLDGGYVENSGIVKVYLDLIRQDECANIMRILTSKDPCLSYHLEEGKVTIIPKSIEEEKIYKYIFSLLGIISNDDQVI